MWTVKWPINPFKAWTWSTFSKLDAFRLNLKLKKFLTQTFSSESVKTFNPLDLLCWRVQKVFNKNTLQTKVILDEIWKLFFNWMWSLTGFGRLLSALGSRWSRFRISSALRVIQVMSQSGSLFQRVSFSCAFSCFSKLEWEQTLFEQTLLTDSLNGPSASLFPESLFRGSPVSFPREIL